MKVNALWAIILILIFVYISQANNNLPKTSIPPNSSISSSALAPIVDADVVFTGVDKYVGGTSLLVNEVVRVFRLNGAREDLGVKSLNSGALQVTPNINYKFYFFMNSSVPSTNYYVDVQDYTGKVQEATDNVVGKGCLIDTKPTVSIRNPDGVVQTSRTNAFIMNASSTADFEVTIASHTDKCYGTPKSQKGNIVCFAYSTSEISNVKTNTNWINSPRSIIDLAKNSDQNGLRCYDFGMLESGSKNMLTVQLTANNDPLHNISIYTDDIGFDLHGNTLVEIWDYVDENGNQLARVLNATPDGFIYLK